MRRYFVLFLVVTASLFSSAQEKDEVLRHIARQSKAMVVFDERQSEIESRAGPCRSPELLVPDKDRPSLDFHPGKT